MTDKNATPAKPRRTRKPKQTSSAVTPPVATKETAPTPAAAPAPSAAKKPTKKDQLILMLRQECGVTLPELVTATGWLPHTARAALTGLRKAGHTIDKGKRDDVTCYSIKAAG